MPKDHRSYGEGCIAAHALDLVGDRWALLVVRELMLGPRRFGALKAGLPGVATNMLTARLEGLEAAGITRRAVLPPPASVPVWELTEAGLGLWPVLEALCRWGAAMPGHDPRLPISPAALMLSMRAQCRLPAAPVEAGFVLDGEGFHVTATPEGYTVIRADRPAAPLLFEGAPNPMAALIYGPTTVAQSAAAGLGRVTGDMEAAQAFVDLFSLQYMERTTP